MTPRAKVRPTKPNKGIKQTRLRAKISEKKRRKGDTQDNKIDKANSKMVVPLQLELILFQLSLQVVTTRRRRKPKISLRSPIIVATKKATMLPIIPSQKAIYSLGNLYVNDC